MSVELRKVFTFVLFFYGSIHVKPMWRRCSGFRWLGTPYGNRVMGIKYCSEDYPARVQRPDRNPFHQSICTCCAMSRDSFVGS